MTFVPTALEDWKPAVARGHDAPAAGPSESRESMLAEVPYEEKILSQRLEFPDSQHDTPAAHFENEMEDILKKMEDNLPPHPLPTPSEPQILSPKQDKIAKGSSSQPAPPKQGDTGAVSDLVTPLPTPCRSSSQSIQHGEPTAVPLPPPPSPKPVQDLIRKPKDKIKPCPLTFKTFQHALDPLDPFTLSGPCGHLI